MKRNFIILSTCLILAVVLTSLFTYGRDYYKKYYLCPTLGVDYEKYPVTGIDISAHQGIIDWPTVSDNKITFALIKATEGCTFVDKRFKENQIKARENNIVMGVYLFYKFNKDGKEQAENFIRTVELGNNDLPPAVDFELSYGNRFSKISRNQVQNQLLRCLYTLEKHYKCKPIIYTNVNTYNKYIKGFFDEYPLWLCKLCTEPTQTNWTFWQYTHKGSIPGIKGNIDMNIFNGSYTDFVNFVYNAKKTLKEKKNIQTLANKNSKTDKAFSVNKAQIGNEKNSVTNKAIAKNTVKSNNKAVTKNRRKVKNKALVKSKAKSKSTKNTESTTAKNDPNNKTSDVKTDNQIVENISQS